MIFVMLSYKNVAPAYSPQSNLKSEVTSRVSAAHSHQSSFNFIYLFFNLGNNLSSGPFVLKMISHHSARVLSSLSETWDGSYLALEYCLQTPSLIDSLLWHSTGTMLLLSPQGNASPGASILAPFVLSQAQNPCVLCSPAVSAYRSALSARRLPGCSSVERFCYYTGRFSSIICLIFKSSLILFLLPGKTACCSVTEARETTSQVHQVRLGCILPAE